MSLDDHKQMARRALKMWGSNSPDKPEDVFAANYINHQEPDVEGGVSTKSLEGWKELVTDFHRSFADASALVLMQIAEGDAVATRWQLTATHVGDFRGLEATGKEVTWTGIQIDRFDGGKIVESWVDWDKYRFLEGLGLVT